MRWILGKHKLDFHEFNKISEQTLNLPDIYLHLGGANELALLLPLPEVFQLDTSLGCSTNTIY